MLKQSYEVEVLINGKPAKEYAHQGKVYVEGRRGTRFSIKIRNNSWSRKLFVPTIDGLSVMDGEEGSYNSSGYIVQAYNSITIDGWRTSDKEVASFYFSSPEGSYRRRMKKGNNLGVIGVAVFDETHTFTSYNHNLFQSNGVGGTTVNWPIPSNSPVYTATNDSAKMINFKSVDTAALCCANYSAGSTPTQQLGTGWGETKGSEVTTVNFERVKNPETVFEIHYNTREELEKEGINFKREPLYVVPQAFPGQYCKPPRN